MPEEKNGSEERDQYGRDASERLVELTSDDAEAINNEVAAGKHDSYDDALEYVLKCGFREIKRTRESQAKAAAARELQKQRDSINVLVGQNPALAANPDFLAMLLKQVGINLPHTQVAAVQAAEKKTA